MSKIIKHISSQNSDIKRRIRNMLNEKNAILLAHYYQDSEIKDVADFVGDSLELAKKAASTDAEIIIFSGVLFMAETAKALNPLKKVLIPDMNASCSLAESCDASDFKTFISRHPDHEIVTYINSSLEVKGLSDVICTSSNAEKIINAIPNDKRIIFGPDKNLGRYLIKNTGRDMVLWDGVCAVHEAFEFDKILKIFKDNPGSKIIAHPESDISILEIASFIGSTSALLNFVRNDTADCFIVATEAGILHEMKKAVPNKRLIPAPIEKDNNCACSECAYMKLNTLEKIEKCLASELPEIFINEELRLEALKSLNRMLSLS